MRKRKNSIETDEIRFMKDLEKLKLKSSNEKDAVRFIQDFLKDHCKKMKLPRDIKDPLREKVCSLLANTHDLEAVDESLEFDVNGILQGEFGNPKGREFLLQRIGSDDYTHEQKLRYTSILHGAGYKEPGPNNDWYLTRIAELAAKCAHDESLCEALILCLGGYGSWISQTEHRALETDIQKAFGILRELYKSGLSDNLQYQIETAAAKTDLILYRELPTKCGPIICILRPADTNQYFGPVTTSRLIFECSGQQLEKGPFERYIVLENEDTKKRMVIRSRKEMPYNLIHAVPLNFGGGDSVDIPVDAEPGKYRVYYQFEEEGKVVSVSHYFKTTLPHGLA